MGRLTSTPPWICPFYSIDFRFRNEQKSTYDKQFYKLLQIKLQISLKTKFRDLAKISTTETETQPPGPVFDPKQQYTNET